MYVAARVPGNVGIPAHGKTGLSKVRRYWPGKAPAWANDAADTEDIDDVWTAQVSLQESHVEELRADHRVVRRAETVSTVVEEAEIEEDEEAWEKRRVRIRERELLSREEEELLPREEEEEADEEYEYETDSEDEQIGTVAVKPAVFVPKLGRDTIAEREQLKEEERRLEEVAKKRLEDRKVETRQMVVEEMRKAEQIDNTKLNEVNSAETDDESNEAEEYESWKHRELARIKRGREEIEPQKVSNSPKKIRNPDPLARPKKRQRRFMQKYYHKGSFFQEDADDARQTTGTYDLYKQDFSPPTGEDKMNKSILPKVMQVKRFGRRGRTKWTHLVNEDTSACKHVI